MLAPFFLKTKCKPVGRNTTRCFLAELKATCKNSGALRTTVNWRKTQHKMVMLSAPQLKQLIPFTVPLPLMRIYVILCKDVVFGTSCAWDKGSTLSSSVQEHLAGTRIVMSSIPVRGLRLFFVPSSWHMMNTQYSFPNNQKKRTRDVV